jgi:hypothetical protein
MLLPFAAGILCTPSSIGNPGTISDINMSFAGTAEIQGDLVFINGSVGPGSFFRDLRRVETSSGGVLLKNQTEVHYFSDRLTAKFYLSGPVQPGNKKMKSKTLNGRARNGLKFKASWKQARELHPYLNGSC